MLVTSSLAWRQSERIAGSRLLIFLSESANRDSSRSNQACPLDGKMPWAHDGGLAALCAVHPAGPVGTAAVQGAPAGHTLSKIRAPSGYRSALSPPFRNQIGRSAQRLTIKGPRKFIEPALVLTVRVQLLDTAASTGTKFHCTNFTRRKRWD